MIQALYTAATGMDAAEVRHAASAENLANAHMPGYRRRIVRQVTFQAMLNPYSDPKSTSPRLGTTTRQGPEELTAIDFTRGPLQSTGRNLDVALEGDGTSFFEVEGPDGPLYTRNGSFRATPDGALATIDGLPLMGVDGPIRIPDATSGDAITITRDGRLTANGVEIGQLQAVTFDDIRQLKPQGASLFEAPRGVEPQDVDEMYMAGFIEGANVAQMDELVNIMIASRQYEAAQKAMRTIEQSTDRRINGN